MKKMYSKAANFLVAAALLVGQISPSNALIARADSTGTNLLVNGDFESGDFSEWKITADSGVEYSVKTDGWSSNNTHMLNIWNGNTESAKITISQTVENVKEGTYKLEFDMDGEKAAGGLSVSVAGETIEIPATTGYNYWTTVSSEDIIIDEEEDVTIEISGDMPSDYWAYFDNISFVSLADDSNDQANDDENTDETEKIESDIYVNPVSMSDDFITGVDVSSFGSIIDSGAKYYDFDGNVLSEQGFFDLLKSGGTNYVRIRVWNNPYDADGHTYGGGACDLNNAIRIGKLATKAGMKVLIDFHYSDFWADPGKQKAPKAFANMSVDEKASAVKEYTVDSLQRLIDAGVDVGMVQIGNETNNGVCGESKWENMSKIFSSASEGVRKISADNDKDILIAVHFTNPETSGRYATYAKNLDEYGVDYDVFASSYYPYWHGTLDNLTKVLKNIADTYDKKVMVAETSYVRTLEDGDGHTNTEYEGKTGDKLEYEVSVQGQATAVRNVVEAVTNVGDNAIGVFYWEPAWIPVQVYDKDADDADEVLAHNKEMWEKVGSGWASSYSGEYDKDAKEWYGGSAVDNEAWFDFTGHPLQTVNLYNFIRQGTTAKVQVSSITADDVTVELGDDVTLPSKATVNFTDNSTSTIAVSWSEDELTKAIESGVGEYEITGTANYDEKDYSVSLKLTINPKNLIINPGFENKDDGSWEIEGKTSNIGILSDSSNVRNGNYCLKFWDSNAFTFKASQTVTLDKGIYTLGTYLEGGDAGDDAKFILFATDGDDMTLQANSAVTGWQAWDNPEISEIKITKDNTKITIGVEVTSGPGGWGAFDDFYLYKQSSASSDSGSDSESSVSGSSNSSSSSSSTSSSSSSNGGSTGASSNASNQTATVDSQTTTIADTQTPLAAASDSAKTKASASGKTESKAAKNTEAAEETESDDSLAPADEDTASDVDSDGETDASDENVTISDEATPTAATQNALPIVLGFIGVGVIVAGLIFFIKKGKA